MARPLRTALVALGLAMTAAGALQLETSHRVVSDERFENSIPVDGGGADRRISGGALTRRVVIEDGYLLPWRAVGVAVVGLGLAGFALLRRGGAPS
jgi:hypothetical protein